MSQSLFDNDISLLALESLSIYKKWHILCQKRLKVTVIKVAISLAVAFNGSTSKLTVFQFVILFFGTYSLMSIIVIQLYVQLAFS